MPDKQSLAEQVERLNEAVRQFGEVTLPAFTGSIVHVAAAWTAFSAAFGTAFREAADRERAAHARRVDTDVRDPRRRLLS